MTNPAPQPALLAKHCVGCGSWGYDLLSPPCGHSIHEACFASMYAQPTVTPTKLTCRASKTGSGDPTTCDKEFDAQWLTSVGMNAENRYKIAELLDEVYARSIRSVACPSVCIFLLFSSLSSFVLTSLQCLTNCVRTSKQDQRVRCHCGTNFCFFCGKKWLTHFLTDCGNVGQCEGKDPILTNLIAKPDYTVSVLCHLPKITNSPC